MYLDENILVSYQFNASTIGQLYQLNRQINNQHLKEYTPSRWIHDIMLNHETARHIMIGVSHDELMLESARRFKIDLEQYLNHTGNSDCTIRMVIWKEHSTSMQKFERAFVDNEPDLWIIFSKPLSFSRLLKRLYRNPKFKSEQTFCISNMCSHYLMQLIGYKYFEGMKGISPIGCEWHVSEGEIELKIS
ncbi:hypothetical protein [Staphylococcus canis]|uniref:Phage protein n=1 Tax=Staphylococcus canis TaxID=2724942 RepID=A0ABS0T8K8_9STAP|nr:hypothetical protein [Staphylococcus canis]MBI5974767.1 hypothetical protein [Staphylococcus canis]